MVASSAGLKVRCVRDGCRKLRNRHVPLFRPCTTYHSSAHASDIDVERRLEQIEVAARARKPRARDDPARGGGTGGGDRPPLHRGGRRDAEGASAGREGGPPPAMAEFDRELRRTLQVWGLGARCRCGGWAAAAGVGVGRTLQVWGFGSGSRRRRACPVPRWLWLC